jgi:hypothetical protein
MTAARRHTVGRRFQNGDARPEKRCQKLSTHHAWPQSCVHKAGPHQTTELCIHIETVVKGGSWYATHNAQTLGITQCNNDDRHPLLLLCLAWVHAGGKPSTFLSYSGVAGITFVR